MNSTGRDIFKAIHKGKWLSIEYRNKHGSITKYLIGIYQRDYSNRKCRFLLSRLTARNILRARQSVSAAARKARFAATTDLNLFVLRTHTQDVIILSSACLSTTLERSENK